MYKLFVKFLLRPILIVLLFPVRVFFCGMYACFATGSGLFFTFGDYDDKSYVEFIIEELEECVVKNQCPLGDSKFHMSLDRIQWRFISLFRKNPGAVIVSEWFRNFIEPLFTKRAGTIFITNLMSGIFSVEL